MPHSETLLTLAHVRAAEVPTMKTGFRLSFAAWLVLLAVGPANTQEDRRALIPTARLQINVFPHVTTTSLLLSDRPLDLTALERGVADALGETPAIVQGGETISGWQSQALFRQLPVRRGLSRTLTIDLAPLKTQLSQ